MTAEIASGIRERVEFIHYVEGLHLAATLPANPGRGHLARTAAATTAGYVVAQVNDQMPRTYGDSFIHICARAWSIMCKQPRLERRQQAAKAVHSQECQ